MNVVAARLRCITPTSTTTPCVNPAGNRARPFTNHSWRPPMTHSPDPIRLTFAPRAWLKFQFLCHAGPTEVGAFGLTDAADLLYVEDLLVVKQRTTAVTVAFDDTAVADMFDEMADAGIPPGRFARVWLHTHPG